MAGIVASLFSAIVITRVVVDYLTQAKKKLSASVNHQQKNFKRLKEYYYEMV